MHTALPELNIDDVDLSVEVFSRKLRAPIIVAGMTGGHEASLAINESIAEVVNELGLGMGVGSQRVAIEDESLAYTFSIVRKKAPDSLIIGNIGGAQLIKGYDIKELNKAIDMVKADAIAIHLNVAQELFQPEGDKEFKGITDKISKLSLEIDKPLIVKEVGNGLSLEVASKLSATRIAGFDVGGAGGTSWVLVEMYRLLEGGNKQLADIASTFACWGIPTAASIVETRYVARDKIVVATGGVRTGLDVAKAIALGADLVGIALPVLRKVLRSKDKLRAYLEKLIYELKIAMILTGCKSISELQRAPLVITGYLREWIQQRGIDIKDYLYRRRFRV